MLKAAQQEEPIVSTGKNWNEHCSGEIVNGKCESETLDSKTDSESTGFLWQSIDPSCCSIICLLLLLFLLLLNPIEGMGIIGKEDLNSKLIKYGCFTFCLDRKYSSRNKESAFTPLKTLSLDW